MGVERHDAPIGVDGAETLRATTVVDDHVGQLVRHRVDLGGLEEELAAALFGVDLVQHLLAKLKRGALLTDVEEETGEAMIRFWKHPVIEVQHAERQN